MALKTIKVSDITGSEGEDGQFASVVVREHPDMDQPKALDVLTTELDTLKTLDNLVVIEVKMPDFSTKDVYVRQADFDRWCTPETLKAARGTRGRVPGSRVG